MAVQEIVLVSGLLILCGTRLNLRGHLLVLLIGSVNAGGEDGALERRAAAGGGLGVRQWALKRAL